MKEWLHLAEINCNSYVAAYRHCIEDLAKENDHDDALVESIRRQPVYLGDVYHTRKIVSSATMHSYIINEAKNWTRAEYERHPLVDFFERNPTNGKYRLKCHDTSVDHIIPDAFGGIDHPRNYCFMSRRVNSKLGAKVDEKFAVLGRAVSNQVFDFAKQVPLCYCSSSSCILLQHLRLDFLVRQRLLPRRLFLPG